MEKTISDRLVLKDADTGESICGVCGKTYAVWGFAVRHVETKHPDSITRTGAIIAEESRDRDREWALNRITRWLPDIESEYANLMDAFTERVIKDGPAYAIRWNAEKLVTAEEHLRVAHEAHKIVEKHIDDEDWDTMLTDLRDWVEYVKDNLLEHPHTPSSSCPYTDTNEALQHAARSRFVAGSMSMVSVPALIHHVQEMANS
jgi:hypothetical protein